ncbi:MAG TPA: universal stress protein [Gemmatimonadales bacterium]|nr:universal stress protein [Gemmatimonadales bacterium]
MTQRIMVPLDGSTFAEAALPIAFELARRHGSTVHLVRVHEPPTPVAGPEGPAMYDPAIDQELELKGRRYLGVMLAWTDGDDRAQAVTAYLHGPVTECLSTYVRDEAIDLVIMATHARGGVSRALLGSVADGLVRQSLAPVLLVRPGQRASPAPDTAPVFRRVLLPVDGGPADDRMIEYAVTVTGAPGVEYTLLRVVTTGGGTVRAALPHRGEDPGSRVQRATVQSTLGTKAQELVARGLTVRPQVVVDNDVAEGILRYATVNGFDLVAMATRSRGGFERLLLGSVADQVLRKAETALLLWNPGQPSTPDLVEAFSFLGTREPTRP